MFFARLLFSETDNEAEVRLCFFWRAAIALGTFLCRWVHRVMAHRALFVHGFIVLVYRLADLSRDRKPFEVGNRDDVRGGSN